MSFFYKWRHHFYVISNHFIQSYPITVRPLEDGTVLKWLFQKYKMAPAVPKKERQGQQPDQKMSKERAMKLKSALINYAKKSNDALKGMVFFIETISFKRCHFCKLSNFRSKNAMKSFCCCRKSKSNGRKSACIPWRRFIRWRGTQATLPRFTRYDLYDVILTHDVIITS